MEKILFVFTISIIALTTRVTAQEKNKDQLEIQSFYWGTSNSSGSQTVAVPGGKGTISFTKQGDRFTNVVFTDAAGKTFRMTPSQPGTNGAPKPTCKYPLPDACFSTSDKNIGMCICKPTDLTGNVGGEYLIGLLLPAVQKVREAAGKSTQ